MSSRAWRPRNRERRGAEGPADSAVRAPRNQRNGATGGAAQSNPSPRGEGGELGFSRDRRVGGKLGPQPDAAPSSMRPPLRYFSVGASSDLPARGRYEEGSGERARSACDAADLRAFKRQIAGSRRSRAPGSSGSRCRSRRRRRASRWPPIRRRPPSSHRCSRSSPAPARS
jgi:hypothetical protein